MKREIPEKIRTTLYIGKWLHDVLQYADNMSLLVERALIDKLGLEPPEEYKNYYEETFKDYEKCE